MKKMIITLLSFCISFLFVPLASAADRVVYVSINDAMNSSDAQAKLNAGVKFSFGGHGELKGNTYTSIQRTNKVGKSDEVACSRAFLSAMIRLQQRAQSLGVNSVTNIVSYHQKNTYSSTDNFECHVGAIMAAVTLKGDIAK